jgi:hypothetical protein
MDCLRSADRRKRNSLRILMWNPGESKVGRYRNSYDNIIMDHRGRGCENGSEFCRMDNYGISSVKNLCSITRELVNKFYLLPYLCVKVCSLTFETMFSQFHITHWHILRFNCIWKFWSCLSNFSKTAHHTKKYVHVMKYLSHDKLNYNFCLKHVWCA